MFDLGALTSGLVIGLREGVEAALIVSIVLAYLARTGNRRYFGRVWLGVAGAVAASAMLGLLIFVTVGEMPAPYEQLFEGLTLLIAAGIVTWMLFWMRRQAANVSGQLRSAVDQAIGEGGAWALAAVAFVAVIREGVETALFLVGQATAVRASNGAASVLVGALVGLALAVLIGVGFYRGTRRIDLARFFRWTGVALVFIAAGLVGQAVHEFVEIGVIGLGTATAYDLSAVLPDDTGVGAFLHALLGYSATPSWAQVIAHAGYLVVVLAFYLRPIRALGATRSAVSRTTTTG
ncbi:MAG TPA: iron uptake transporter permease EfeU [Candidatus Dormibacteraeota bacterium]|jgi:high-affinity iron transporter|nr:iron uptake transporter permease EfeU [Candidatus Dormibacteraeota bacterium]